jgi:hypothetical protein
MIPPRGHQRSRSSSGNMRHERPTDNRMLGRCSRELDSPIDIRSLRSGDAAREEID